MQYIRADANEKIASGHLMRCMAIAKQLINAGEKVTFIISDIYSAELLKKAGYPYIILNTKWDDMEGELSKLEKVIIQHDITRILVDSYQVTQKYFQRLKEWVEVVYIDDGMKEVYDVFALIHYSHMYEQFQYNTRYSSYKTKLYLGCDYIPLREEFQLIEKKSIKDQVNNVMVTVGGSDGYRITESIIETLAKKYDNINFHIVIGPFFESQLIEELKCREVLMKNVLLYENACMSGLMRMCDAAISAGGTTLYEMCACGVPTICFSIADNQVPGIQSFTELGFMLGCGDIRQRKKEFIKALDTNFSKILHWEYRKVLSEKCRKLIDGKGAMRIARIMMGDKACDKNINRL